MYLCIFTGNSDLIFFLGEHGSSLANIYYFMQVVCISMNLNDRDAVYPIISNVQF